MQVLNEVCWPINLFIFHFIHVHKKKCSFSVNMPNFVKTATERISNFRGLKYSANELDEAYQVLRSLKPGQEIFLGSSIVSMTHSSAVR